MQRKTKNILSKSIIVLLICSAAFYVALHVRIDGYVEDEPETPIEEEVVIPKFVEPEDDLDYTSVGYNLGDFLYKDIYINGYHINNWQLYEPFILTNNTVYIPMSECVQKALGIHVEFNDAKHLVKITKSGEPSMQPVFEDECACNLQFLEVYWGHTYYINETRADAYSAVTTKDYDEKPGRDLYISGDALKKYSGIDFSYYYDDISGYYISTIADIPAEQFFSENNQKYIEGRARYMMQINSYLDEKTAFRYEYLFRHEAANSPYISQDQLMGICQTESRFVHVAQSPVAAIGLMQVMFMYAEPMGYTLEMLQEPHYNIQFGRSWFDMFGDQCDGNVEMTLTSYYMGVGGMQNLWYETGSYSSNYSDVCISNKNMLESWVEENGYSNTFLEYTGQ